MLHLARDVSPALASVFAIIIVAGIYTTAVPLLWTVAQRFFADRSLPFRLLAVGESVELDGQQTKIKVAAHNWGKSHGRRFSTRKVGENKVRVTRIEVEEMDWWIR